MRDTCLLCPRPIRASSESDHPGDDFDDLLCRIECESCGQYVASERLFTEEGESDAINGIPKYLWAGVTRNSWELNGHAITLTRESTERGLPHPLPETVSSKSEHLLRILGRLAETPTSAVPLEFDRDCPLIFERNGRGLRGYLDHLNARGWTTKSSAPRGWASTLTPSGWDKYEALVGTHAESEQAFVAMWFAKDMDPLFDDAIKHALEGAGWAAYRVDRDEHTDRIDDKILTEIKASRFMVADFTGQRQSVYFEAGFAKGMRLDVIWTCREDEIKGKEVSFDARQYNFLPWTEEDLPAFREALTNRILVLHGRGPRQGGDA
jgi:hypothetical protein